MSAGNTIISVSNLKKVFKLPRERQNSVKSLLINFGQSGYDNHKVLDGISFEIEKGEFFGIVGRNGSGKSTLLKLLAGIYTPTSGDVRVDGKLTPFIELGVGFNPELTGRENVFLNGALLGFNRKDMTALYDDIVEFAELERFMDQKLKNYSSGMQVRLAFSIAIRAKSDILLIDEVLAVGDANFQKKCYQYFYELKKNKQTVVLVTHDMGAVKNFCDRAILIDQGKILAAGGAMEIAEEYSRLNVGAPTTSTGAHWGNNMAQILSCTPVYKNDKPYFSPEQMVHIVLRFRANADIRQPIIGITIKDVSGREVLVTNTKALSIDSPDLTSDKEYEAVFQIDNVFTDGTYTVTPAIASSDITEFYAGLDDACVFEVLGWPFPTGIIQAPVKLKISNVRSGDS